MFISTVLSIFRQWKKYNANLNELVQLEDHELADIGISRYDVPRIAWENAAR